MVVLFVACPGVRNIKLYRSLSEPGASKLCDANTATQINVKGKDERQARAIGEREITVKMSGDKQYCGAYIYQEGAGKALDGQWNYGAMYQACGCE